MRAAWHASVLVPTAPMQPLHQGDLGLHPPLAQLHAAGIWRCGVPLLCAVLTLYSLKQSAIHCQLPVGCGAGKHAVRARRQHQQVQLCL
jgi:hypothetical protein